MPKTSVISYNLGLVWFGLICLLIGWGFVGRLEAVLSFLSVFRAMFGWLKPKTELEQTQPKQTAAESLPREGGLLGQVIQGAVVWKGPGETKGMEVMLSEPACLFTQEWATVCLVGNYKSSSRGSPSPCTENLLHLHCVAGVG